MFSAQAMGGLSQSKVCFFFHRLLAPRQRGQQRISYQLSGKLSSSVLTPLALLIAFSGCDLTQKAGINLSTSSSSSVSTSDTSTVSSSSGSFSVTAVIPPTGSSHGGTTLTILGAGFLATNPFSITLGSTPCSSPTYVSSTQLTCVTQAVPYTSELTRTLHVIQSDFSTASLDNAFTYSLAAAPTVTSIAPNSGTIFGNTTVTITGTNFVAGSVVSIGGFTCDSLNLSGVPTQIICNTPAHSAGSGDVSVTNPDLHTGTLPLGYLFQGPTPVITTVSPTVGAVGTTVTITGTGFYGPNLKVLFDSTPCTQVIIKSSTQVTCTAPPHNPGTTTTLKVVNPDGTASANSPNQFTYLQVGNQVFTGANHSCALVNGGVMCWGKNDFGQLGNSDMSVTQSSTPLTVIDDSTGNPLTGVQAIALGDNHSCALTMGLVKCWGNNASGQLGVDKIAVPTSARAKLVRYNTDLNPSPSVAPLENVKSIATGGDFSCAIYDDTANNRPNSVRCWGSKSNGQLGYLGATAPYIWEAGYNDYAIPLSDDSSTFTYRVQAIRLGKSFGCYLRDGKVYCWGDNSHGQAGNSTTGSFSNPNNYPIQANTLTDVSHFTTGDYHVCAVQNDKVYCWGSNSDGQLGNGASGGDLTVPTQTPSQLSTGVQLITAGGNSTCAINNGSLFCWGKNDNGQLGDGTTTGRTSPTQSKTSVGNPWQNGLLSLSIGATHTCAIGLQGVQCWGINPNGELGISTSTTSSNLPIQVTNLSSSMSSVAAGGSNSCGMINGGIKCWGDNTYSQLGNPSFSGLNSTTSVSVQGITMMPNQLSVGGGHGCTVLAGRVWCWGSNSVGQLGMSSNSPLQTNYPVEAISSGAMTVVTGQSHTCALLYTGAVQCWGDNSYGELGDGSLTNRNYPVTVAGLSNIVSIAAGAYHTCAASSSRLWCWGRNDNGQLGTGSASAYIKNATEVLSGGISIPRVAKITAGMFHTCILTDGAVACWGDNSYDQIGAGGSNPQTTPFFIPSLYAGVTSISAGGYHTCTVINGGVQCWGYNNYGQIGNNSTAPAATPVSVSNGNLSANTMSVSAGLYHSCAFAGLSYWCWGYNSSGQIGNNTTTDSLVPVQVTGF